MRKTGKVSESPAFCGPHRERDRDCVLNPAGFVSRKLLPIEAPAGSIGTTDSISFRNRSSTLHNLIYTK
jgi:hypothetical protein